MANVDNEVETKNGGLVVHFTFDLFFISAPR